MEKFICKQCGKEVEKGVPTCPWCGAALGTTMGLPQMTNTDFKSKDVVNPAQVLYASDNGSFGWIALGVLLPPVGILLYFLKRKKNPHAKAMLGASIASLTIICAVLWVTGVFRKAKTPYPAWIDYSNLLGKDKAIVLEEVEKKGLWGRESGNEFVIEKKEALEKGHNFTTELWFSEEGYLYAVTKGYTGRVENDKDFIPHFYKQMVKFYGKPDQPSEEFKYDTWDEFYDGMVVISSSTDEKRTLLAIWREKQVAIEFEVYNEKVTIKYILYNQDDKPGWIL